MNSKELMASMLAQPLLNAAVDLKIQYEKYIHFLVENLEFTEEEATTFANGKINKVNEIGDRYFQMKKEGKDVNEIAQQIIEERAGENE